MPTPQNPKPPAITGYATLVKKIQAELSSLDFFVKRRTAESYWKVGRFIHEHLLENKERADYGNKLFELLENDVDRDASTLRKTVRFYRAYPILSRGTELSWSHYRALMTVKDDDQRKELEKQVIQKNWDAEKLRKYLSVKRELATSQDEDKPIPQLKFTRGRLNILGIVPSEEDGEVDLDLGFRVHIHFPQGKKMRLKAGDCVHRDGDSFEKTSAQKEEIFAYKALVQKIVDGDTLWIRMSLGFGITITQKLRLRGIDSPEIDTEEGKRAKKFVEARLKDCAFIVIKTHKDTTDKYDRYLADIWYLPNEDDEQKVAAEGKYLNQELLDNKLAVAVG